MKVSSFILMLLFFTTFHICLSKDTSANIHSTEEAIINLNEQNFEKLVDFGRSERWFVMFHVGCPACQEVYPIWNNFTKSRRGIQLGSVNATTYPALATKYGIKSFPSFAFFDEGKMEIYHGENTVEDWNKFISLKKGANNVNQTIPDAVPLEDHIVELDRNNFDNFVLAPLTRPWFVMFHTHCPDCEVTFPAWREFARSRKEGPNIGMVDCDKNPELAQRFNIKNYPTFVYFQDGEEQIFNGEKRVKDWSQYVDQKQNKDLAAETPVVNITNNTNTSAQVTSVESVNIAVPTPEVPEMQSAEDAVVELTQDNFESLVNSENSGSWFIMFHAPWCPHCQRALPTWKEFGNTRKAGVRVGTVDCVAHPGLAGRYNIPGFPTFMYFNGGKTEVFNGERSVQAWSQFIDQKKASEMANTINTRTQSDQAVPLTNHLEGPSTNQDNKTQTREQFAVPAGSFGSEIPNKRPISGSIGNLEPAIGNLNAINTTIGAQNTSSQKSEPKRLHPEIIESSIGGLNALNRTSEAKEVPITTVAYERPAAGATEARPGVTVETMDNRPNEGRFEDTTVHYREPMLVIGVVAAILLGTFFLFMCYQQFRGKYAPLDTMDRDMEAAHVETSTIKRDSFSNSMRF